MSDDISGVVERVALSLRNEERERGDLHRIKSFDDDRYSKPHSLRMAQAALTASGWHEMREALDTAYDLLVEAGYSDEGVGLCKIRNALAAAIKFKGEA